MFLKKCTCIKRKCSCRRISSSKLISNWTRMEQKHTALFGTSKKMKMVKNIWFKIFVLKIRKKFLPKKKTKITTTLRLQENAKKQKKMCSGRKENLWMNNLCKLATESQCRGDHVVFYYSSSRNKNIYRHIDIGVQYMSLRRPTVCQYRERELT